MQTQTDAFRQALKRSPQLPFTVADIIPGGAPITAPALATLQGDAGQMTLDETRPVRRAFTGLHLLDTKGTLTPGNIGDLLHPETGNEVRLRRGLSYKRLNLLPPQAAYPGLNGQLAYWTRTPAGNAAHDASLSLAGPTKSGVARSLALQNTEAGATNVWAEAASGQNYDGLFLPSTGLPYCAVVWAMPVGVGLNVMLALDIAPAGNTVSVDLPANVWSPIVVPAVFATKTFGSVWVQLNSRIGGGVLSAGDTCLFDAFGVYTGVDADPQRPLNPSSEYNWLGAYRFDVVSVTDTGPALEVVLNGMDRGKALQKARWTGPKQVARWATIPEAIREIADDRWIAGTGAKAVALEVDFSECLGHPIMDMTVPNPTFGADQTATDPLADLITLAAVGGCEFYLTETGNLKLRPFVDPSTVTPTLSYLEAPDPTDLDQFALIPPIGREITPDNTFSGIVVTGGGNNDPGCRAVEWDTDPASPTFVGKIGEQPTFYESPLIRTPEQASIVGRGLLARLRLSSEVITAHIITNPGLEGGDAVYLDRQRAKATGNYLLASYTIDLSPVGSPMEIVSRSTTDIPAVTLA